MMITAFTKWALAGFVFMHFAMDCSGAAPGDILGSFTAGGPIYASPTLSPNGTIYLGANDAKCYAITPSSDGLQQTWSYAADEWIDSTAAIGPDGTIYFTTYNSTLVAVDPTSDSEKWTTTVGAEDNALGVIRSSPATGADENIRRSVKFAGWRAAEISTMRNPC